MVDNNSHDASVEFVQKNYPNVKIIKLNDNYGFAKGNNIGASKANGEYIVFLNNDTIADPNWLTELVNVANKSSKIGIVASKIYNFDDRTLIDFAGSCCDKYLKSDHLGRYGKDKNLLNFESETFYACGAAFLIKRELYKKIGLFESIYFIYCEDLDLSWRTWIFGYKVIYAPKSIIYHKVGLVMSKDTLKKKFLHERNRLRTLLKNYEFKTLLSVLPFYFLKRLGVFIRYLLHCNSYGFLYLTANIKALFWNILHFKSLIKIRKKIQTYRTKSDKFIFQLMDKTLNQQKALKK
jgi:GT2 family glycosyltransferase